MQSRFRCSYCSALVELREESKFEIWQIASMRPARDAERAAARWLREQGIERAGVRVEGEAWACSWLLHSRDGEEFQRDASNFSHPLLPQLPLPAGPRAELEPQLPEPSVAREEIERAAQAAFRDDDAAIESARLIYQPLRLLRLRVGAVELPALYLCASDQLLVAPLPEMARRLPADRALLGAYGGFLLLCLLLGASIDSWLARAFWMLLSFSIAVVGWRGLLGRRGAS